MRIAVPHALQSMTSSSSQTKWKFVRNATMKQQSINKQNGQKKYIIIYLINPFIWCKSGLWRLLVQAAGPCCQLQVSPHFLPPQNFSFQPNFGINTFIPEFVVDFSRGKLQNIPQHLTTRSGTHRTIHNAMTPLLCTFLYLSKTSEFVTAA